MFYIFNKQTMQFQKKNKIILLYSLSSAIISAGLVFLLCFFLFISKDASENVSEEERISIIKQYQNDFTEEKFMRELLRLNVKYPHIVMAQAVQESGFNSPMFKHNNNMLGMKVATRRPSTNIGERFNHANYENWRDAVIDYAIWQSTFIMDISNEEEYYQLVGEIYSESDKYVSVVRPQAEKWKKKFDVLKVKLQEERGE